MSIANLEILHKVTSLHSLCFFSKVYKKQETRRKTFNFSGFLQNFANQLENSIGCKIVRFSDDFHRSFLRNVANFHLRIHAEFSKPRDTFQNEENEGSIFDSKTRNGPNRGMFITVAESVGNFSK